MPQVAIVTGLILIGLGAFGYFGTETRSMTAWIPAFFGVPLLLAGLLALKDGMRKHGMHAAAAIGLLGGLAAAGRGAMSTRQWLGEEADVNTRALTLVWVMAVVCFAFVGLCVKSFIDARRRQRAAAESSAESA